MDVRGHGNSEGLPGDEYDATELADGVAVIHWLAQQEWCSGRVGMFGISWGGFNSLQIAALAPEPLKAIVTVCSTDDRYDNDVHYMGGSVLAVDMHAWAATMLAFVCRPPDPAQVGEGWKDMWLKRLEAVDPYLHTWLAHQTRDDYWKHGSVCEDYSAIRAKVLAVGGWHDPYRDTVLRLVEHLDPDRVRGLIGPWSHQYPDRGLPPGPAIGFLQETLRWWDQHLKDKDTGIMAEPLLRSWISESHRPATVYERMPGRWVGDTSWPSENIAPVAYALRGGPQIVDSPQQTGLDAGRFFPFGNAADLPPDQRDEDAKSVSFEFPVEDAPIEILGRPRVKLRIRMDAPRGQAIARLCDVAPDGSSTLVTRGALNLSARHGRDRADDWPVGRYEDVTFDLNGIGHTFPPGHRIRLAISSSYWPWIWPQAGSVGFTLDADGSFVELPVRRRHRGSRDPVRGTGAVGAARRRPPRDARRTAPRAAGGPRRRQGRMAAGGRPALRRHPHLPGRPRIHRGRPGDVHNPGGRPALRPYPLRLGDPAAPAGDGMGRTDRDPLRNQCGRHRLHHVQRGGLQGRRRGRLPPHLGEADPAHGGLRAPGSRQPRDVAKPAAGSAESPPCPRNPGGTVELSGHQEQLGHSRGVATPT